jgi:probable HAF family extracellular repeat protein
MSSRLAVLTWTLPLLLTSVAAAAPNYYVITDMGVLPGDASSAAYGVNDSGQVVGASISSTGVSSAVLFSGGSLTDVGALASLSGPATAMAVNDAGSVLISAGTGHRKYGYVYSGGTLTELSTQPGVLSGAENSAYAINNSGQITGVYATSSGTTAAFVYSGGTAATSIDIENSETTFHDTAGFGINNLGAVVGSGTVETGAFASPFIWSPSGGIQLVSLAAGAADAVNDSGVVVGSTANGWHAPAAAFVSTYVTTPSASGYVATTLPSLGNGTSDGAYGISNTGLVVGESAGNALLAAESGGVWTATNLNSLVNPNLGWNLQVAEAISNNGNCIAGYGTIDGQTQGFLLQQAIPGDANLDGRVDVNDLTIVLSHFGQTGANWSTGDFIGDGRVDVNDLTIVLSHFGQSLGSSAAAMAPLPEPASLLLAAAGTLGGALGLLACAWRKRRLSVVSCRVSAASSHHCPLARSHRQLTTDN